MKKKIAVKKTEEKHVTYVNFCPVCNSTEVEKQTLGETTQFHCKHCKYTAATFPEIDSTKVAALGPVKKEIVYPKVEKKFNNRTAHIAISMGIILMIFAIYLLTVLSEKAVIVISTTMLIIGIIMVIDAINKKNDSKK